jgi:predicted acetyltransferase
MKAPFCTACLARLIIIRNYVAVNIFKRVSVQTLIQTNDRQHIIWQPAHHRPDTFYDFFSHGPGVPDIN